MAVRPPGLLETTPPEAVEADVARYEATLARCEQMEQLADWGGLSRTMAASAKRWLCACPTEGCGGAICAYAMVRSVKSAGAFRARAQSAAAGSTSLAHSACGATHAGQRTRSNSAKGAPGVCTGRQEAKLTGIIIAMGVVAPNYQTHSAQRNPP